MDKLDSIIEFAERAHGDQVRKFEPEPYINHLVRVMGICAEYTNDNNILAAALLHDTLEDTPVTEREIIEFLEPLFGIENGQKIVEVVKELTDQYIKKDYRHWNRRKRKQMEARRLEKVSSAAQTIKYADIIDNSLTIVNVDNGFVSKYLNEVRMFLEVMKDGNPELRTRAIETIDKCLESQKSQESQ